MPHAADIDLTVEDIGRLASADAVAGFFTRLGYPTGGRKELTATALGLAGETADDIRGMELLAEDSEQLFRVVFVKLRSITAKARNDLSRNLGKRNVDHLLVLASDFEVVEFVLIDKRTRQQSAPGGGARVQIIPRTVSVMRKASTQLQRRILRRLTWTGKDGLDQFDKLRSVFEAAAYTGEYFQNRALFADHYLETRLKENEAWAENPSDKFIATRELMRDARTRWTSQSEAKARGELYEPVWKLLGFKAKANKPADKDRLEPDYILNDHQGEKRSVAFVYRWDRWLDGPDLSDPDTPDENPGAAVVSALARGNARWIIVSNGKLWRLYSRDAHSRSTNFYEVDLEEALLASGETDPNEAFRYWWLFFRPQAFSPVNGDATCWLDTIVQGSRDYAKRLGERLKERIFVEIFPHLAHGFLADRRKRLGTNKRPTDEELKDTFEATLTLLYRLLFLLYAEARDLLPIRESPYYAASLKRIKEEIADKAGTAEGQVADKLDKAYSDTDTKLYDRLARLFAVMDKGDSLLNVPCYNGGLFITDPDDESEQREHRIARFLAEHKVPDRYLALAIDRLARDPDEKTCGLVFIDYKSLEVRHLGSIYEGLLEFKLKVAEEDLTTTTEKKREKYIPLSQAKAGRGRKAAAVVRKGEVYLSNDKAERKATGSYYTPDPIVEYIVEHTVGPVLADKLDALRDEFNKAGKTYHRLLSNARSNPALLPKGAEPREFAAAKTYAEHKDLVETVFDFKVLDPAMGSGHFLVEAVDFLTDRILDFLNRFPNNPVSYALDKTRISILEALTQQSVTIDPDKLTDINLLKRHVLKRCIYGVDLNPMAVELAKVSLWLDAFTLGAPLSFLDHHLRCGNSLVGEQDIRQHVLPGSERAAELCQAVHNVLQIAASADANPSDVQTSKTLFADIERICRPFKNRLHVETGQFFIEADAPVRQRMLNYPYDPAFDPARPPKNAERSHAAYLEILRIAEERRFFHWDLEFPEVYFGLQQADPDRDVAHAARFERAAARRDHPARLPDTASQAIRHKDDIERGSAGFDAIIGNPPYVRQETIKEIKPFLKARYTTFNSTNDLYVFFQEQEVRNLRVGGRMGMIVANKWMRAGYGERLRGFLQRTAQPLEVIDFGHSPIFPDADTFPCIPIVARRTRPLPAPEDVPDSEQMMVCAVPREHWDEGMNLVEYVQARRSQIPTRLLRDDGWSLEDPRVHQLLGKVRQTGVTLKEFCGASPIYGLKTGFNEAFFIDAGTRDRLVREDRRSAEIIKPLLRGRDVDRWRPRQSSSYLIFAHHGIKIEDYPAIKRHLAKWRAQLEPKPPDWDDRKGKWMGRKAGDYAWYETQDTGEELSSTLGRPRILYQVILFHSFFSMIEKDEVQNDKAFVVPSSDLALLAILNSPLMWWYMTRFLPHMKDEALATQGFLMENIPVCVGEQRFADRLRQTARSLLKLADRLHAWEEEAVTKATRQFDLSDANRRILPWLALPQDVFVSRMAKLNDSKRPCPGVAEKLIAFQSHERNRQIELLTAQLALEREVAGLVEDAYGLTPEERELLRATRPVRDPIDVLEAKIAGKPQENGEPEKSDE